MKLLPVGAAVLLALGALSSNPAEAGVESAYYGATRPLLPGECQQTQDRGDARWRPSQGRLVIVGQGYVAIEFFGHFFDMIKEARITGMPGAEARIYEGYNGATNNGRGCGAIGSVVVTLKFDQLSGPNNGILHLDDQQIPITLKPWSIISTTWEEEYARSSSSSPATAPSGTVAQPNPITIETGANCDPSSCGGGGTTTYVMSSPGVAGGGGSQRATNFLGCAIKHGLAYNRNSSPPTLTITLPAVRSGAIETCFNERRLEFRQGYWPLAPGEHFAAGTSYTLGRTPTRLNVSANGGLPLRNNTNLEAVAKDREFEIYGFNLAPDFLKNFVGRKSYTINPDPGGNLTLELVSSPEYGVKALAGPLYPQNVGRLSSAVNVRLTPHNATAANQPFAWKVTASGIAPETCFEQVSGSVTPPAGQATVVVTLTATEREVCVGKSFTVNVYPQALALSGQDTLFEKEVTFVLPAKQKLLIPDATPTPNVPDSVGANIRRQ